MQADPKRDWRITNSTFYSLFYCKNLVVMWGFPLPWGRKKMRKLKIKMKHQVITSHFPNNCVQSCQLPNRLLKPEATLGERGGMCWPVDGIYKGLLSGDWLPQPGGPSLSTIGKGKMSQGKHSKKWLASSVPLTFLSSLFGPHTEPTIPSLLI